MEYDYYRYTVAVSLSPLLLSSPSLSGFHSVTFLWRNESTERWTDKHRLWHQGSTAWERGSCWYGNNDGLNKKKKKKTRLCFSLPPPHLFYEKAKIEHVIYVLDVFEHSTTQSVNIYNLHI